MQKKTYVRPELIKHGKVESLTQGPTVSHCSAPCSFKAPAAD
jgi:hypothetical protein